MPSLNPILQARSEFQTEQEFYNWLERISFRVYDIPASPPIDFPGIPNGANGAQLFRDKQIFSLSNGNLTTTPQIVEYIKFYDGAGNVEYILLSKSIGQSFRIDASIWINQEQLPGGTLEDYEQGNYFFSQVQEDLETANVELYLKQGNKLIPTQFILFKDASQNFVIMEIE